MGVVAVLTAARRAPRVHIEALAPRQPPHAALLRPRRHKLEAAAGARGARWRLRVGLAHSLVGAKWAAAEAARIACHARAVGSALLRAPHNVHATRHSSLGATALSLHHSLGPRRDSIVCSGLLDLGERGGLARQLRHHRAGEPRVHSRAGLVRQHLSTNSETTTFSRPFFRVPFVCQMMCLRPASVER